MAETLSYENKRLEEQIQQLRKDHQKSLDDSAQRQAATAATSSRLAEAEEALNTLRVEREKKLNSAVLDLRVQLRKSWAQRDGAGQERYEAVRAKSRVQEENKSLRDTIERLDAQLDVAMREIMSLQQSVGRAGASTALLEPRVVEVEEALPEEHRQLATTSAERHDTLQGEEALRANAALKQEIAELRALVEHLSSRPISQALRRSKSEVEVRVPQLLNQAVSSGSSVSTAKPLVSNFLEYLTASTSHLGRLLH